MILLIKGLSLYAQEILLKSAPRTPKNPAPETSQSGLNLAPFGPVPLCLLGKEEELAEDFEDGVMTGGGEGGHGESVADLRTTATDGALTAE